MESIAVGDDVRLSWTRVTGDIGKIEGPVLDTQWIGGRDFWIVGDNSREGMPTPVPKDTLLSSEVLS